MHDYKNQLSTIQTLIKNGHTDEALSFTQKLTESIAVEMSAINTNHPVVNAVLNQKYRSMQEKHIAVVSEIKELAQRAANTTSKTELESIHRQRTRLCAEYISDVSPDRKALYQQAKNAVKSQNGNPKCKGIGELSLLDFLERAEGKNNNLAQKKFALAGGGTLECPILTGEGYGADISYQGTKVLTYLGDSYGWGCERTPAEREKEREFYGIYFNEYHTQKNAQSSELKELPNYLEEKTSFDRKA